MLFITHCLDSRKLQPSTIKIMISGIQFHIRCLDPSSQSLLQNPSIHLLLNGLKKENPAAPDKRLPLSLSQVHAMVNQLRLGLFNPHANSLLEAVFLTAFYGFLRGGEFTINKKFDPVHDLSFKDVSFHADYFSIYLKHSKTDRDNNGTTINISRTNDGFCPFTAMNRLLSSRSKSGHTEPLFITEK